MIEVHINKNSFLGFILLIFLLFSGTTAGGQTFNPPKYIANVQLSSVNLNGKQQIKAQIKLDDGIKGIYNQVTISLASVKYGSFTTSSIPIPYNKTSGIYEKVIDPASFTVVPNDIYVNSITLNDPNDIFSHSIHMKNGIDFNSNTLNFNIGQQTGFTSLIFHGIQTNATTLAYNDKLLVRVNATNTNLVSINLKNTDSSYFKTYYLIYNSTSGFYETIITFDQYSPSTLSISQINMQDKYGNKKILQNGIDFNLSNIAISGTTPDLTPPVLNSIKFGNTSISVSGTLFITVNASDNLSGISDVNIYVTDGVDLRDGYYDLSYNSITSLWEAYFTIPIPSTYWGNNLYVAIINLYDNAGNSVALINNVDFNSPQCQLTGTTPDTTAPAVSNPTINSTQPLLTDFIKIGVSISDSQSGLGNSAYQNFIQIYSDNGTYYDTRELKFDSNTNTYYAYFRVFDIIAMKLGYWPKSFNFTIFVRDNHGNTATYINGQDVNINTPIINYPTTWYLESTSKTNTKHGFLPFMTYASIFGLIGVILINKKRRLN